MPVEKKSNHKNAVRSRHLIKQAFAELLNEKDISKITVTNIVERANISRGTFYAHYLDVYDLNNAIQSNIVEAVNDIFNRAGVINILKDPTDIIKSGIQFLDKNKSYYKLFLTSAHGESILNRITALAEDKLKIAVSRLADGEEEKLLVCHLFYTVGAIKNILIHWFNEDFRLTAEECSDYIIKFSFADRPEILDVKLDAYKETE